MQPIVLEARTWIDTPFHHQGRVQGVGCDCIGLIVGVAKALGIQSRQGGLLADYDVIDYSRLPDGFTLQEMLERHLYSYPHPNPLPEGEGKPGDVLLFSFYKHPQHVGIVSDYTEQAPPWRGSGRARSASRGGVFINKPNALPPLDAVQRTASRALPLQGGALGLIHCHQGIGKVAEHGLSEGWRKKAVGVYRFCAM